MNTKESQVSTTSYWYNWIVAAKEGSKNYDEWSKDAWDEYLRAEPKTETKSRSLTVPQKHPIFWKSIEDIQPAYYSRTPKTVAKRMFDNEDPVARTAGTVLERLSKYLLHVYPINDGMIGAVKNLLLTGRACTKLYCEEEQKTELIRVPVLKSQETGELLTDKGEIVEPEQVRAEGDLLYIETEQTALTKLDIELLAPEYDDVLHTPNARCESEIKAKAFKLWVDRNEFIERFGAEKLDMVSFTTNRDGKNPAEKNSSEPDQSQNKASEGVLIWEIWDIQTKKVRYLSDKKCEEFLREIDDPYKLEEFFPSSPFITTTKPGKSMYPTSMYVHLKPFIEQLHTVFTRMSRLIKALRRRGIASQKLDDVIKAINEGEDLELIVSKNFESLVESGGIEKHIYYIPLQELSNALVEAQNIINTFKGMFDELSGVPDIVRGSTNPNEGVQTQQLKGQFYNVRSSWNQLQVQELARKSIEMMCDLALAKMPDSMLMEVIGAQFLDESSQQNLTAAIELLRNDKARQVRLEVETDSLSYLNDQINQQNRAQLAQTISNGFREIAMLARENPLLVGPSLEMLLLSVRGINLGKEYEDDIKRIGDQFIKAAQNPPQAPPPPPDYKGQEIGLKAQKQQQDFAIKSKELGLKAQKQQIDINNDGAEFSLEERIQGFKEHIELARLELERYETVLSEKEKLIEEQRLAQKQVDEANKVHQPRQSQPSTNVNIITPPSPPANPINPLI